MTDASAPTPADGASGGASGPVGPAAAGARGDGRRAWILGGSLLAADAVLVLVANGSPVLAFPGAGIVLDGLWAVALLVFAFGIRGSGSVVARRPAGVIALVVSALLPLATAVLWWVLPAASWDVPTAVMVGQGQLVLSLAALLVATVVIGRAGAVPERVRWVPLIVLGVAAGAQLLAQAAVASFAANLVRPDLTALVFGSAMLGTLGVLLLGILAIVFAPRVPAPGAVQVFPPAE